MLEGLSRTLAGALALGPWVIAGPAAAHFQELLPSTDILPDQAGRSVTLSMVFTHPMEGGPTMDMGAPVRFGVLEGGRVTDLTAALVKVTVDGKAAYRAAHTVKEPGDSVFFLEPAPYWEPAERTMITHYAKVVVDFASGQGWDKLVGLPVEIEPLTRPYGLWTHNVFSGRVLRAGKPEPFAIVEVEWLNDGSVKAPSDPFITQVVKADGAGVFHYAPARAGWWGLNAVLEGEALVEGPGGKPVKAELGGTLWIKAVDMR